jgi:hypothetical protein
LSAFIERHQTTGDAKMTTWSPVAGLALANCAFRPAVNERVLVIFISLMTVSDKISRLIDGCR